MFSKNFLKRAKECLDAAGGAFEKEDWNASAINAIHCAISAGDALCVHFSGKRRAGESHNDAVKLVNSLENVCDNIKPNAKRLMQLLKMKNMAEYEERLIYKSEAEKMLRNARAFYEFVELSII
jgi:HEPN domain-containing protein